MDMVPWWPFHVGPVYFGHHKGNIRLHAEGRAIVDHHGPRRHRRRPQGAANVATGGDEGDIDILKGVRGGFLYYVFSPANGQPLARRTAGSKQFEPGRCRVTFFHDAQELGAHCAGCPHHRHGQVLH